MQQNIISALNTITNFGQAVAVAFAAVMLMVIGYQYFAMGDEGAQKAKKSFINLVIGLGLIFLATFIANWLKGVFSF